MDMNKFSFVSLEYDKSIKWSSVVDIVLKFTDNISGTIASRHLPNTRVLVVNEYNEQRGPNTLSWGTPKLFQWSKAY